MGAKGTYGRGIIIMLIRAKGDGGLSQDGSDEGARSGQLVDIFGDLPSIF